jgi:hypothetical protein
MMVVFEYLNSFFIPLNFIFKDASSLGSFYQKFRLFSDPTFICWFLKGLFSNLEDYITAIFWSTSSLSLCYLIKYLLMCCLWVEWVWCLQILKSYIILFSKPFNSFPLFVNALTMWNMCNGWVWYIWVSNWRVIELLTLPWLFYMHWDVTCA